MPVSRSTKNYKDYTLDDDEEDEDEEDPAPRRTRRPVEDDEEEERPVRRTRRPVDEEEEEEEPVRKARRRPVEEVEEEEEDPNEEALRSSIIQSGWKAAKQRMEESSDYAKEFKFDEEYQVVKFLSAEPFIFRQHWLEQRGKGEKKSFVCIGDSCPLCRILGDTPSNKYAFPIVNLSEEGMPTQLLVAGIRLAKRLERHNQDPKDGPLEKLYWAIARTGKAGGGTDYNTRPIKERDLADDWEIDPDEVEKVLSKAKPLTADAIFITPRSELLKIARQLAD